MINENIWDYRADVFRPTTDFDDLLRMVAMHFKMYSKAVNFVGPWVAKQSDTMFIVPDRAQVKEAINVGHPLVNFKTESMMTDSIIDFISTTKGRRALIQPHVSTHHSIQLHESLFTISRVTDKIQLRDDRSIRRPSTLHKIEIMGIEEPVYVENLRPPVNFKYMIIRPKLGKHNMPSVNRWEVLFFKNPQQYLINHADSSLNPRYAGII
jgi:hypothetical protein